MNHRIDSVRVVLMTAGIVIGASLTDGKPLSAPDPAAPRMNFLLITVDDMDCDSVGVYGCRIPGITPEIDRLAASGVRFEHAHVTIAVCQPCRAVWLTGRYPHRNGAVGFQEIRPGVPTLLEALKASGYTTGILGKVAHCLPSRRRAWDVAVDAADLGLGRDPQGYFERASSFMAGARSAGRPFFLMANSHDPHRPFAGSEDEARASRRKDGKRSYPPATDAYRPGEVPIPGFLPDIPGVRREIAQYFTSVRRADRTTGALLRALEASGMEGNTLVMFLSDNGMAFPFAKTNCYRFSTRTPWIVRWPGKTKAGGIDAAHMISGIDLAPTVLDILGLKPLEGVDGRSFKTVLAGGTQDGRDRVFTHFHRTAARNDYPMRAVMSRDAGYIYNAWSDGETIFKNESQSGLTMNAMRRAAAKDPAIAARVKRFLYREPEELYHYEKDPDALRNLADDPAFREKKMKLRGLLLEHMEVTGDPLLEPFRRSCGSSSLRGS